jgi:hypothetical protein
MKWIDKNSLILKKFNIITQNSFESVGGVRPEPGGEKRREYLKLDQTWKEQNQKEQSAYFNITSTLNPGTSGNAQAVDIIGGGAGI